MKDRYGTDVLRSNWQDPPRGRSVDLPIEIGLVVEDVETQFCGAVTRVERGTFELEDRHGMRKSFRLGPGFWIDGKPVTLTEPRRDRPTPPARTASGSVAVTHRARTAIPSRIFVEGRHDAELLEKVWGDDLRLCGVAVEVLQGVDHLPALVEQFAPTAERRMGVLVDHFVTGSKEWRLAQSLSHYQHAKILGHPFLDVWQAVRAERVGLSRWPDFPRGVDVKVTSCRALGWPAQSQADIATAWKRILGQVRGIQDLDPSFSGRVEELIDFATVG